MNQKWISINEMLPEPNERILAYRPNMTEADIGPVSVQWGWTCRQKRSDISHWMPLPKLIKGDAVMKVSRDDILRKAIETWGMEAQSDMCIEECSELIKALLKYRRAKSAGTIAHIREEIADVQIMIDQMRLLYGDTEKEEAFKVHRLGERLGIHQEGEVHD